MRIAEFESLANGSAFRFVANPQSADAQWLSVPGNSDALVSLRKAFEAGDAVSFAKEATRCERNGPESSPRFNRRRGRSISRQLTRRRTLFAGHGSATRRRESSFCSPVLVVPAMPRRGFWQSLVSSCRWRASLPEWRSPAGPR